MSRLASDDHRFAGRVRVGVAVVTATGIVFGSAAVIGATAAAAPPAASASQAQTAGGALATGSGQVAAGAVGSPKGPLSPRLQEIAADKPKNVAALASAVAAAGLPQSGPGSLSRGPGVSVEVIIRVAAVSDKTRAALQAAGAQITVVSSETSSYAAYVAPKNLNAVTAVAGVIAVSEILRPQVLGTAALAPASARTDGKAAQPCAPDTSLADTQLKAALARTNFGVDGTGIKIGVLSGSFAGGNSLPTSVAQDVASGNLPGVGNPCGYPTPVQVIEDLSGGDGEGRAMLQLVHKIAPGATLMFATGMGPGGELGFANNIRALQAAGANVIVDDIAYDNEPMFQEGIADKAISEVTDLGVTYLAAAGNFNQLVGGNDIGSIDIPFTSTSCPAPIAALPEVPASSCLNFGSAGSPSNTAWYSIAPTGGVVPMMQFSEPLYGVTDNLDFFLLDDGESTILGSGTDNNIATGIPFEGGFGVGNGTSSDIKVKLAISRVVGSGTPRVKTNMFEALGLTAAQYPTSSGEMTVGPSIFGHNGGTDTLSVAATSGLSFSFVGVPDPFSYSGDGTTPANFSSRGPLTHYWAPFTTADNPAGPIPATVLHKPDFTSTTFDCTSFFSFDVTAPYMNIPSPPPNCPYLFSGTSAAAPNAAGVAALVLSRNKTLTPAQVKEILIASAAPMSGGSVGSTGAGLLDANAALGLVPLPPTPTPTAITPTPTPVDQAQGPLNGCVIVPKSIPSRGKRKLQRRHCATDAGQTVKVKVTGRLRGDTALWKVVRKKNGKVFIRTYGHRLKLRVTWEAPATGNYAAYSFTRTYRT